MLTVFAESVVPFFPDQQAFAKAWATKRLPLQSSAS